MKSFKQFLTERASISTKYEPKLGEPFEGGYYVGDYQGYYLIASPKKLEEYLNWQDAKDYCEGLLSNHYQDWYLPSRAELTVAYATKDLLLQKEGFDKEWYWSSSEKPDDYATTVSFNTLFKGDGDKLGKYRVRPFRKIKI